MRAFLIGLGLALAAYGGMLFLLGNQMRDNKAAAFLNRGVAYDARGDYKLAIADFDEALRIDPNNRNAFKNRKIALTQLAKTEQKLKASTSSPSMHGN
jgi:tetratricopeptide (TPR) repeat protein